MIFENNYAYAGTTAIIYNLEIDVNNFDFSVAMDPNSYGVDKITLPSTSKLTELGIEYKKESDSNWNILVIVYENKLNSIKNGSNAKTIIGTQETDDYVISPPIGIAETNFISPIRIVIKNLEQSTTYNIRSYYIDNNVKYYYNVCSVTTMQTQDITYVCTAVTGGTEEQNEQLRTTINKTCDIYNSMTSFNRAKAPGDYLGSKTGGSFTATIDSTLPSGAGAVDSMKFRYASSGVWMVAHEMAHNLMKNLIDESYSNKAHDEIVKFMEFATHTENATWRWMSSHNYPVISSATYSGVYNYLVAAACQVCRSASDLI